MNYDHYIALDWSNKVMAFSRSSKGSLEIDTREIPSDIREFRVYLDSLRGSKILTFEESTPAQWLYTELRECVDEIIVCDPYRNRLLSEGPKTDKIDSQKLLKLLKSDLLKPVYHSAEKYLGYRVLVSGYRDLVQRGVRLKNQKSALENHGGWKRKDSKGVVSEESLFVIRSLESHLKIYEEQKKIFEKKFLELCQEPGPLKHLKSIPGIGNIGAIKVAAMVVDAKRFPDKYDFWSYCGLVKHDRMSGGKSYGKKNTRFSRTLKEVFKTAAMCCTQKNRENPFYDYYHFLMKEKSKPDWQARHLVARRISAIALGVLRTNKPFNKQQEAQKANLQNNS